MEMNLSFNLEKFQHLIEGKLEHWLVEAIKLIPNLIVAFVTFLIFIFVANISGKLFKRLSNRVVDSQEVI
ncbi:mechanosensitive ion channel family protein, partial [Vibrio cyclitrophicus]